MGFQEHGLGQCSILRILKVQLLKVFPTLAVGLLELQKTGSPRPITHLPALTNTRVGYSRLNGFFGLLLPKTPESCGGTVGTSPSITCPVTPSMVMS